MVREAQIQSINPATEDVLATFEASTPAQTDEVLELTQRAFQTWRHVSFAERAVLMRRAAEHLRTQRARLAGIITAEMGKPIVEAEAEVEKCAWNCEFYADNSERFLAD